MKRLKELGEIYLITVAFLFYCLIVGGTFLGLLWAVFLVFQMIYIVNQILFWIIISVFIIPVPILLVREVVLFVQEKGEKENDWSEYNHK